MTEWLHDLPPRPIDCFGGAGVEHETAFIPDAVRTVADLAGRDEACPSHAGPAPGHLGRELGIPCPRDANPR